MTTRIEDMPVFSFFFHQIDAGLYNLWRRAKLHLNFPLRLEIPGFEYMVLIIENDNWVVVDENKSSNEIVHMLCKWTHSN